MIIAGNVCRYFDGEAIINDIDNTKYKNAYNMIIETACAETQFCTHPDNNHKSGFGGWQFDKAGFDHTIERSLKYRDEIYNKFRVDISVIKIEELRYNPFLSIILCRLFYKTKKGAIPSTREGRAEYWKKHYNTSAGAGTVEHYMESCERILG